MSWPYFLECLEIRDENVVKTALIGYIRFKNVNGPDVAGIGRVSVLHSFQ